MRYLRFLFLTSVVLLVSACASRDLIVLLPDDEGKVGMLTVQAIDGDQVVLDKALASAEVGTGAPEKVEINQDQVDSIFKAALDAQPPKPLLFRLYFHTDSTVLTKASRPVLNELFETVAKRRAVEVQVTGHTDRVGDLKSNDKLALRRARAVVKMLIKRGIKSNWVRAVGRGEREPLVATADGVHKSKNRRVEVIVR